MLGKQGGEHRDTGNHGMVGTSSGVRVPRGRQELGDAEEVSEGEKLAKGHLLWGQGLGVFIHMSLWKALGLGTRRVAQSDGSSTRVNEGRDSTETGAASLLSRGSREIGNLTSVGEGLRAQAGKDRRLSERNVLSLLPGTEVRCRKNFIINKGRVLHAMVRYTACK